MRRRRDDGDLRLALERHNQIECLQCAARDDECIGLSRVRVDVGAELEQDLLRRRTLGNALVAQTLGLRDLEAVLLEE